MTNELQTFAFQGVDVRTVLRDGIVWWVLRDVCDALNLTNPSVVAERLDDDERAKFDLGRQGETNIVNESGLYNVILRSDKPEAKTFKRWVTSEVLPSIRKNGVYALDELLDNPDLFIDVIRKLKEEREQRALVEQQKDALQVRLDEASEWYTVKRWAATHNVNWRFVGDPSGRGQGWRRLKALSAELGYEIHKSFDANYEQVNAYHQRVFEAMGAA